MRKVLLVLLLVLPGLVGMGVFGSRVRDDWTRLEGAQIRFEAASRARLDLGDILVANAVQDIHRTNLFAEGTWALMCGVIAAIGLHGLLSIPTKSVTRRYEDE